MSQRKPGKPTLSPTESERVLTAFRAALLGPIHKGNQSSLARALRVEPSAISQLHSGKNLPSIETAKALAAHIGEDWKRWMDPSGPNEPQPTSPESAQTEAPQNGRKFYTKDQWQPLLDPALEKLIREGFTAAESRKALESAVSFNTDDDADPTLEDVLRFARVLIKEKARTSGKLRKSKHS